MSHRLPPVINQQRGVKYVSHSHSRLRRVAGTIAVAGALLGVSAGAASAAVYPAGHNIGLGSSSVSLQLWAGYQGTETCTISGGSASIPTAPGNTSASLTLTTRPTFSGCGGAGGAVPYTVTTSGTWTLKVGSGAALVIPANGITATSSYCGTATNRTPITLAGAWHNGSTAPTFIPAWIGPASGQYLSDTFNCIGYGWNVTATSQSLKVVDLTSPTSVVYVGP
jgi:hypothetical protein